ncbi:MAG: hypothetical protein PHF86_10875 [Candidatus Nanoarchaeia archaeon]|jgi:hypothetical protein|nr:hypothetical protein [Candidatus Nanoarchaeia archaeon]
MTKEQWQSLKVGDFIYSKTGSKREIVKISQKNGLTDCVSLKILRHSKYNDKLTVYCANDRKHWQLKL